jgi:hypothetical protein
MVFETTKEGARLLPLLLCLDVASSASTTAKRPLYVPASHDRRYFSCSSVRGTLPDVLPLYTVSPGRERAHLAGVLSVTRWKVLRFGLLTPPPTVVSYNRVRLSIPKRQKTIKLLRSCRRFPCIGKDSSSAFCFLKRVFSAEKILRRRCGGEKDFQLSGKPIGYSGPDRFGDRTGSHLQIAGWRDSGMATALGVNTCSLYWQCSHERYPWWASGDQFPLPH